MPSDVPTGCPAPHTCSHFAKEASFEQILEGSLCSDLGEGWP